MLSSKERLRALIKHKNEIRCGKSSAAMPNPNDIPPEMRPHMDTIKEISKILGPVTSSKPPKSKPHKPLPKKEYHVNSGTIFKQQLQETTPNTSTIPFFMSKVNLPDTKALINSPTKPKTSTTITKSSPTTSRAPFTLEAIRSIFST